MISVGNTRTKLGVFRSADLDNFEAHLNADSRAVISRITELASAGASVVMASVNDAVADSLQAGIEAAISSQVIRIGRDLPVLLPVALDDDSTVGQDRLLNALGAFSKTKQACIVVDCGTATTVDFIDGEGTFQGGAIGPGMNMMLKAMHQGTAKLPALEFVFPDAARGVLGKDTPHAMMLGVSAAVRGMVHDLIDRYAEFYEAYPNVIATGGDAPLLFENDALVEKIVPSLQLIGIFEAFRRAADPESELADDDLAD